MTKFIVTCEVDDDGTTHTKIDLTGYSIRQAEEKLTSVRKALLAEHWAMIEHHFPHAIPYLDRRCHLYEGMVIRVRDKNPNWEPHQTKEQTT